MRERGEPTAQLTQSGEVIAFEVLSGGFDPAITIFEQSGSWFDPRRANRIAFNDEPMWAANPSDAQIVHKFAKAGRYLARVEAFSGLGGPDSTYQLRIGSGTREWKNEPSEDWQERAFERPLTADRLNQLAARGGKAAKHTSIETYRASAGNPALFKLPGTLDGILSASGEVHRARFQIDGPQDIVIEVETPASAPPLFHSDHRPPAGSHRRRSRHQRARGRWRVQRGDVRRSRPRLRFRCAIPASTRSVAATTADLGGPGSAMLQVPGPVGEVGINEDRLNLAPGSAPKAVRVTFDREDYRGAIAVSADRLPPGCAWPVRISNPTAIRCLSPAGASGTRRAANAQVVVFTAAADIRDTVAMAHILVLPVVDGKPGEPLASKTIPVMVVRTPWKCLCALLFAASAAAAARAISLKIVPADATLRGANSAQQFLAIAHDDGTERDVTAQARWRGSNPQVAAFEGNGRLVSRGDGETRISATLGKVPARTTVRVKDSAVARPFSFPRDISAVLAKHGCNSAACHGGVKGQGGFKLSAGALYPRDDHGGSSRAAPTRC